MECLYCNAELEWQDSYGNYDYICHGDINGKAGDIYRCPNCEGFDDKETAIQYAKDNDIGYQDWEEICCDSNYHSVCGGFYTDKQENLYEGYLC
ncbi:hypothetical protein [Clostridium rectalis]|uniref:hypothetical protein n=1 Tax=Clostridium rectalis TaxID=2040295 RepID=UPI000F63D8BA|nr:hypothetical protein [Clostridium rectalis]